MQVTAARTAALEIMRAIRSGELADRAFARQVEKVPERDRAWLHELAYGTLRLRGRLDFVLGQFVTRGLDSLDDDILDILRLGAYQLLEMRSVPAYAAVSQSVELAKSKKQRAASGLVNGVLQSLRRAGGNIAQPAGDAVDQLSTWGSHPRWLVERWVAAFGESGAARLCELNNEKPAVYLRRLGGSATGARVEDSAIVAEGSNISGTLKQQKGIIQDPAASLVARYAAPQRGLVADLCAAPGGKTIVMADMLGEGGVVAASDVSFARLQRVRENAARVEASNVRFVNADARAAALRAADLVLIDAPCTGTGTFRRHPDGKWRIQPEDLHALVALQREILDSVAEIVNVGGVLVYATCSLEPEENREQVSAFLDRHPNFLRRPPADWDAPQFVDEVGDLVMLPHAHGYDGAFAARLERVA